jgi:hypothetical protein
MVAMKQRSLELTLIAMSQKIHDLQRQLSATRKSRDMWAARVKAAEEHDKVRRLQIQLSKTRQSRAMWAARARAAERRLR